MPAHSLDIAAVSYDNLSVESSSHVEIIWPDHPHVVDDHACDYDSVGTNVVKSDPFISTHHCLKGRLIQSLL